MIKFGFQFAHTLKGCNLTGIELNLEVMYALIESHLTSRMGPEHGGHSGIVDDTISFYSPL